METHIAGPPAPLPPRALQAFVLSEANDAEEWAFAWDHLSTTTPDDKAERCSHCDEVWEYMGSVLRPATTGATILHQFRHRHHPHTRNQRYELIPASPAFHRRHGCCR